jgi:hypothetical protein
MDFTSITYRKLLESLISRAYIFQPYAEFLEQPQTRCIILRHDVEARYRNALDFARIQYEYGIRGTYYFRFLPYHFDREIIHRIAEMGHEIGYHYDDLSHCKGDFEKALQRFEKNLATLREIAEVKTICMEGAPLSKWDNRDLWGKHQIPGTKFQTNYKLQITNSRNAEPGTRNKQHYRDFGIIGEPYFDTDFTNVFYLTDTGRRWDGKGSVRDKVGQSDNWTIGQSAVGSKNLEPETRNPELIFHGTSDIIEAAKAGLLPDQIMMTFHPQRWTDKPLPWIKELVLQNVKNVVKRVVVR